jgi:ATP-binding cassette subfamily F protein 3
MRHALTRGLQDYEGALVLVSHDRSLLRATADELWLVDGGAIGEFDGDLEDYARRLRAREQEQAVAAEPAVNRKEQKRIEAQERNRRFAQRKPLESRIRSAEKEMEALGAERRRLENLLAAPDMYDESKKEDLKRYLLEQARVTGKLRSAEEQWLRLSAELETLTAGA